MLEYIEKKNASYIRSVGVGYESRISLSLNGKKLFNKHIHLVDKIIEEDNNELVVLTDKKERTNSKGKIVKFVSVVPIKQKSDIKKANVLSERIKLYNNFYKNHKISVKVKDIEITGESFIEELFRNSLLNKISDLNFDFTVILNDKILDDQVINKYLYAYSSFQENTHLNNDKLPVNYVNRINVVNRFINNIYKLSKIEGVKVNSRKSILTYVGEGTREKDHESNDIDRNYDKLIEEIYATKKISSARLLIHNLEFTINQKNLFRVFSRNSFEKHGRFYGPLYQCLKKELRNHIYVDDSTVPLVSLDFGEFHTTMAYHLSKEACIDNPYNINGCLRWRKYFKDVAMVALNANDITVSKKAVQDKFRKKHNIKISQSNCELLINEFANFHSKINERLNSDFAIDAMYLDGQLIDDCLYELMIVMATVVLPVHDELLCPADKVDIVKEQMIKSYRKVLKAALVKNGKLGKNDMLPDYIIPKI